MFEYINICINYTYYNYNYNNLYIQILYFVIKKNMSSSHQCLCKTSRGTQCTRFVTSTNPFCWQHQNCTSQITSLVNIQTPYIIPNKVLSPPKTLYQPLVSSLPRMVPQILVQPSLPKISSPLKTLLRTDAQSSSPRMLPQTHVQLFPEQDREIINFRDDIPDSGTIVTRTEFLDFQSIEEINKILNQALIKYQNDITLNDVMRTTDTYGEEFSKHATSDALRYIRQMENGGYGPSIKPVMIWNFDPQASIFVAGVLEYLALDIIELASYVAKKDKRTIINISDINRAIETDDMLLEVLSNIWGG